MALWELIVLLGLVKLAIAGLMLWIPYRNDQRALNAARSGAAETGESGASEDDGGSTALPGCPLDPRPRSPRPRPRRRDPHGSDPLPSPARIRTPTMNVIRKRNVPRTTPSRARIH